MERLFNETNSEVLEHIKEKHCQRQPPKQLPAHQADQNWQRKVSSSEMDIEPIGFQEAMSSEELSLEPRYSFTIQEMLSSECETEDSWTFGR